MSNPINFIQRYDFTKKICQYHQKPLQKFISEAKTEIWHCISDNATEGCFLAETFIKKGFKQTK